MKNSIHIKLDHLMLKRLGPVECQRELPLLKPPLARPIKGPPFLSKQKPVNSLLQRGKMYRWHRLDTQHKVCKFICYWPMVLFQEPSHKTWRKCQGKPWKDPSLTCTWAPYDACVTIINGIITRTYRGLWPLITSRGTHCMVIWL